MRHSSHHFTDGQHPGPQAGGQQFWDGSLGVFKPTQEPVALTAVSAQVLNRPVSESRDHCEGSRFLLPCFSTHSLD